MDKNHYSLSTYTFDTIVQILFVAYTDGDEYVAIIDEHSIQFALFEHDVRDGITVET